MKRTFDCLLALIAIIALGVPMLAIAALIKLSSGGPVLYWSDRIGRNNVIFRMPKFRTMHTATPAVATHLLTDAEKYVTYFGRILRKSSLDELPQLISILRGDMSFVGPRPALFNQHDLVKLRTERGVHVLTPGLTGWAQINGRDELAIPAKVECDEQYLKRASFLLDLQIIVRTVLKLAKSEGVLH